MRLIVGGASQGKLAYALQQSGCQAQDVAVSLEQARKKPILNNLQDCIRQLLQQKQAVQPQLEHLLAQNPTIIILCDEVGCGIVPLEPQDRAWREEVGRACCFLAAKAQRVERIFCGLPLVLKEEPTWK